MSDPAEPEVFCLVTGRAKRHHCFLFHLSPRHDDVELIYPLWVIRRGDRVVLVDTGFTAGVAAERSIADYRDPGLLLASLGIAPAAVETVIVSHLHYDHFGMPERFPNATFAVQSADVAYFLGSGSAHPASALTDGPSLAKLEGLMRDGRVQLIDGDAQVAGLDVLLVGGHTPGSQLTRVPAPGGPILLACDAAHFYANARTATPTAIIHTYEGYQNGFARIRAHRGRWFPGHDPAMLAGLEPAGDRVYRVPRS